MVFIAFWWKEQTRIMNKMAQARTMKPWRKKTNMTSYDRHTRKLGRPAVHATNNLKFVQNNNIIIYM